MVEFDTLNLALQAALAELRTIDGMRNVPDYPIENPTTFPFLVGSQFDGEYITESMGQLRGLHNIQFGLYTSRKQLSKDFKTIQPFGGAAKNKLLSPDFATWNDTITGYGEASQTYTFGATEYFPGLVLIGWTIRVQVKIREIWHATTGRYIKG